MVDVPPLDPQTLLPPLLACLPIALVSSRPPPALLSLLSPILRQRVQILTEVGNDSWLRLLCWDNQKAEEVQRRVDSITFESHPISGEFEILSGYAITYRRLDKETLRSQVVLLEYGLCVLYEWCPNDGEGHEQGWRMAELLPLDSPADQDNSWSASVSEANAWAAAKWTDEVINVAGYPATETTFEGDPDEDNYWARYDSLPSRTSSPKGPESLPLTSAQPALAPEDTYFARYADVQPALDNDDPDRTGKGTESSLPGNLVVQLIQQHLAGRVHEDELPRLDELPARLEETTTLTLNHPRPSSASSSSSGAVARLEQEARSRSMSEIGVKQHISVSIKNLHRLARSAGITREEFQELVRIELDQLE
jgi:hypothetical protein